jgi:prepilin-type N-terminal cleavage/methylation domain-containing protein/prepilin-type processing-associated H-X9-DG protein
MSARKTHIRGFTLVELLVVIGIIALLISILLPVLNKARAAAQKAKCMSNQKQIAYAWRMYVEEHKGWIPNSDTHVPGSGQYAWPITPGDGTFDGIVVDGSEPSAIKAGSFYKLKYLTDIKVWKCPSENIYNYCRNYGINSHLNGERFSNRQPARKISEIKFPSNTFVSIDEEDLRQDGYNIGSFGVYQYSNNNWIDAPGNWHDGGACLSFVDGHAEYHKWVDWRTIHGKDQGMGGIVGGNPYNKDLFWLQTKRGDFEKCREEGAPPPPAGY